MVDPLFTLALAVPLAWGIWRRRPARIGLLLALAYLGLGAVQHQRAAAVAAEVAAGRGHRPERLLVKPTIGNLVLWRALYVVRDSVWVDAVRVGWGEQVFVGGRAALFNADRDLACSSAVD